MQKRACKWYRLHISVDNENIELHGSNDMERVGLAMIVLDTLAAMNIMGKKTKDDPAMNNNTLDGIAKSNLIVSDSKLLESRLEILGQGKYMSAESDPLSVAANLAFAASDNVKVHNAVDSWSLDIPTLNQLAALIWNRVLTDYQCSITYSRRHTLSVTGANRLLPLSAQLS